jgi:hypothetical protein
MMDGIENQRRLTTMENNFRIMLRTHTAKLIEAKRIYWKNRAKIRWINLGDEISKKIRAIATQSYRKNYITSLKTDDNSYVTNHDHKADVIWNSYKERLWVSNKPIMSFILDDMVHRHNLDHLDTPFTNEEIMAVIKDMPTDRAPGPDGFNSFLMKKCRDTI